MKSLPVEYNCITHSARVQYSGARVHTDKSMQSSFQTAAQLELPATQRNCGTNGAAAARQPVLQQGPLRRRAAIICQTATRGRIDRWEWKPAKSLYVYLFWFQCCWEIHCFICFYYLIYLYKSVYLDIQWNVWNRFITISPIKAILRTKKKLSNRKTSSIS